MTTLISIVFIFVLIFTPGGFAESTKKMIPFTVEAPPGWIFEPETSSMTPPLVIKGHPGQAGILREIKEPSNFLTIPVLIEARRDLAARSDSAQLVALEKSVGKILNKERDQSRHVSKKIINGRPTIEVEIGKPGKGFTWIYSTVSSAPNSTRVMTLIAVSRDVRPPSSVRDEFFALAQTITRDQKSTISRDQK